MNEHTIFYYPYGSFTDHQALLLKAAALYFDKLYILDPVKASWNTIGAAKIDHDLQLLEQAGILVRVAPEEVLHTYEEAIANAIRADLADPEFVQLCRQYGQNRTWTLALAKVPRSIRTDSKYAPLDRSMQWLMRELAGEVMAPDYIEVEYPDIKDGYSEFLGAGVEYRQAEYPLELGESIMLNHALFGGLLHTSATPLTDDPFHNRILNHKIERAQELPEARQLLDDRASQRSLGRNQLAVTALTDIDLAILPPDMPLEEVLRYRDAHDAELQQARAALGWLARDIKATPWTKDFADEIEHKTIPHIYRELQPAKKSSVSWLKVAAVGAGGAAAIISLVGSTIPLLPMAVVAGVLGLVKDSAIPGVELALDWKNSKRAENGLHYLMKLK